MRALLAKFEDDLEAILQADAEILRTVPGVGAKIAEAIQQIDLDQTARLIERWQKAGVQILTWNDDQYPKVLRDVDDAPPTLFVRGYWDQPFRGVALVGTRTPTLRSAAIAHQLAALYTRIHWTIVSGLAMGIDTAAHRGTLDKGGHTIAVLGSGVLNIYPPENVELAERIMERSAIVCEVQPEATVSAAGLVARNRIITGLSQRVIVVETESDGGAMHAARFALMQRRELFAVKNNASGNQELIADGAFPLDKDDLIT